MYNFLNLTNTNSGDIMDIGVALNIIPRSLISLMTLFLVTKLIGKRQVSELSLFDYVIGISIGNFSAEMVINREEQYINGIIAMATFGIFAFCIAKLSVKSIWIRRLFIGVPTVLIDNGEILVTSMKKLSVDINDLLEEARSNGYFNLDEISYAIMEASGKISFLPYEKDKPVTKSDMKVKLEKDNLAANVIIDSKLMINNIHNTNKSVEWVKKELEKQGYLNYDDILLATLDNNQIKIYTKGKKESYAILE